MPAPSRTKRLIHELDKLHDYGCRDALLIDRDGLIVAATSVSPSAQDTAALAAQMLRVADKTTDRANAGANDEIAIRTGDALKLVCRTFTMGKQPVFLVCTLPYKLRHRRATNTAIRAMQQIWQDNGQTA